MVEKMNKILGKLLLCILSCMVFFLDARVTLELKNDRGQRNQVIVGQPFTVDVVIYDAYGSVGSPKGLEKFATGRTGVYMSNVNGKAITRYSYEMRIDAEGTYAIGPAIVTQQQQEMRSEPLQISVVKDPGIVEQKNQAQQSTSSPVFLRLMVNTQSAVVGQKIGCALRFYYQDPSISLNSIGSPDLSGFELKEAGKVETGIAEVDGSQYRYAQWRWDMYPKKPGEFIIPAYSADYEIPVKDSGHMFAGFLMFMNARVDRKRVYSNAATVKISPLPYYDGQVHTVGSFERIAAEIKPAIAKEGEGMVLTIEIEGTGNFDSMTFPALKLPESLKYYDSRSTIIQPNHADGLVKKQFEFIVQGMKSGDHEIPEQRFVAFDPEKNEYVTLSTPRLAISIMPGALSASKKFEQPPLVTPSGVETVQQSADEIADINAVGQWYPTERRQPLPWWIIQLLFLIPCFYIIYLCAIERLSRVIDKSTRFARWRAFKLAHKKVRQCIERGDAANLYSIFNELFQHNEMVQNSIVREQFAAEWNNFFERIAHAAYARSESSSTDELCRMAQQWLDRLQKQ
jgi:hypothetical protein